MTSPQNWTLYKTSKKTHQRIKESRVKFPILQWVPIWMTACCVKLMAWTRSARDQTQEGLRIKIIHLPRRENSLNCNEADTKQLSAQHLKNSTRLLAYNVASIITNSYLYFKFQIKFGLNTNTTSW